MNATTVSPPRAGSRSIAGIPRARLEALNHGEVETATLVEALAIDFATLLRATFPQVSLEATKSLQAAKDRGITQRMALAGKLMLDHFGPAGYLRLARNRSDTVRGWAAYLLAASPDFTLGERLQLIRALANDHNAGVREWAWLALRPHIAEGIDHAIDLLEPWTVSTSPFLRRFASEATRPRGVWCRHIDTLKREPFLGLLIIEPLRADPHRYVQDSVANWLNDAGKSQPQWVRDVCSRWHRESESQSTVRICRRALRSVSLQ